MEWIKVSDKLPEVDEDVLIYERLHFPPAHYYMMAVTSYKGPKPKGEKNWYEWSNGQDEQPSGYAPTHWMKLPEPPKND